MVSRFRQPPDYESVEVPANLIAVDGSLHETSLNDRLPTTRIGYVKIGSILVKLSDFEALRVEGGRFVDPFRVARLEENNWPIAFVLPSSNVLSEGCESVVDSFRTSTDQQLLDPKTRFRANDYKTSLRSTLFELASIRTGVLGTDRSDRLKLHRCPTCGLEEVEILDIEDAQRCPGCGSRVYPSDALRLWEEVKDFQSNRSAITRFMNVVEHLCVVHYIKYLFESDPSLLSKVGFFIDGPLALFGTSAWLHGPIMKYLWRVSAYLTERGMLPPPIIGLQKSGQLVDHFGLLERFLKPNTLFSVDDEYRYANVISGRNESVKGFGSETYYGQDFIFKTESEKTFVFGLPFPFYEKGTTVEFARSKIETDRYPTLSQALRLITKFETALYENAVIPIALAHGYTSISLVPGSKVLDLMAERALGGED